MLLTVKRAAESVTVQLVADETPKMLEQLMKDNEDKVEQVLTYHFGSLRPNLVVQVTFYKAQMGKLLTISSDEAYKIVRGMCVQHSMLYHDDPYAVVTLAVEVK